MQGGVIGRLAVVTWVRYVTPGNCVPHVFKRDVKPSAESGREWDSNGLCVWVWMCGCVSCPLPSSRVVSPSCYVQTPSTTSSPPRHSCLSLLLYHSHPLSLSLSLSFALRPSLLGLKFPPQPPALPLSSIKLWSLSLSLWNSPAPPGPTMGLWTYTLCTG